MATNIPRMQRRVKQQPSMAILARAFSTYIGCASMPSRPQRAGVARRQQSTIRSGTFTLPVAPPSKLFGVEPRLPLTPYVPESPVSETISTRVEIDSEPLYSSHVFEPAMVREAETTLLGTTTPIEWYKSWVSMLNVDQKNAQAVQRASFLAQLALSSTSSMQSEVVVEQQQRQDEFALRTQLNLTGDVSNLATVRDMLRYTTSFLGRSDLAFGQGTRNAYEDALVLVCHVLRLPLPRTTSKNAADDLLSPSLANFMDCALTSGDKQLLVRCLVSRVDDHVPTAYITGQAHVGDYAFHVTRDTLIPRSYLQEVLLEQIHEESNEIPVKSVLEICTGSGYLAVLASKAFPTARVDACDLSSSALQVAHRNISDHQATNVFLYQGDLHHALNNPFNHSEPAFGLSDGYDMILCNPPYVGTDEMSSLPPEYLHEPSLALAGGGNDGLDLARRVVESSVYLLSANGQMFLECANHDVNEIEQRVLSALPSNYVYEFVRDNQVVAIQSLGLDELAV
jgi:ribosomal protein L3 glutamine methyltransferase